MSMHTLKQEFKLKHFFYQHPNERVFYCCQWRWPRFIFVIIRTLLALYLIYGLIHLVVNHYQNIADRDDKDTTSNNGEEGGNETPSLMVYFTVWSYIMLMLHFILAAILSVVFYKHAAQDICEVKFKTRTVCPTQPQTEMIRATELGQSTRVNATSESGVANSNFISSNGNIDSSVNKSESIDETQSSSKQVETSREMSNTPSTYESFNRFESVFETSKTAWYFRLSWCLSNIVSAAAPVVTIIFFTALYDPNGESGLDIQNTNVHTLNLVFVIIDHLVSARPIRLLHVVAPLLYGLSYILFSIIYWSTDHKNHVVYPGVLDWNDPGIAIAVSLGLAIAAIPLLQLMFFGIYQLKGLIHKKLYGVSFDGVMD